MSQSQPLNRLIFQFLESVGIKDRVEENFVFMFWDGVVGKEIAQRTEPTKIKKGILFVKVDDSAWRSELQYFKNEIMDKLNKRVGKKVVEDIKFY